MLYPISTIRCTLLLLIAIFPLSIFTKEHKQLKADSIQIPNLPANHLIRYLNTFPRVKKNCFNAENNFCQLPAAIYNNSAHKTACWGHEYGCDKESRFQTPTCPGNHTGWVHSKEAQVDTFYSQADFGYVQHQIHELQLMCAPLFVADSSLECTSYLRFCRGRNVLFDFRDVIKRKELIRYHIDVLSQGQILGHCDLNRTRLRSEMDHMSALQSWSPEVRNFDEIPKPIFGVDGESSAHMCDLIVDTPTFIMKIDATYNMYHHFCDFFNLYATLFVNLTHPSGFDTNTQIIIWESYPYDSPFAETFKAFSHNPVWTLNEVKGKRVCFRNVIMSLLPRMIFGLFYNTPLIHGCQSSGLFRAFSEFILHRLEVPFHEPLQHEKVRITFLLRRTQHRKVLNEDELIAEISKNPDYEVRRLSFERGLSFTEQLSVTRNTDVLIGMHGAGLTHLLFLPNWATIFELYNCEDPNCYKDLARLRGVNYITWSEPELVFPQDEGHHPQHGGAHAKFTNYAFDPTEFARLVADAVRNVREHAEYQNYQQKPRAEKDEL